MYAQQKVFKLSLEKKIVYFGDVVDFMLKIDNMAITNMMMKCACFLNINYAGHVLLWNIDIPHISGFAEMSHKYWFGWKHTASLSFPITFTQHRSVHKIARDIITMT